MEPLPIVLDMLKYFEKKKITLSRKSLIVPALQDEVYFIDGRPAGGL